MHSAVSYLQIATLLRQMSKHKQQCGRHYGILQLQIAALHAHIIVKLYVVHIIYAVMYLYFMRCILAVVALIVRPAADPYKHLVIILRIVTPL